MGRIDGGYHADGSIVGVTVHDGAVWVERYGTTGAASSPEFVDLERWRWVAPEFVEDEAARTRRMLPPDDPSAANP